jgi:hypothetical protein
VSSLWADEFVETCHSRLAVDRNLLPTGSCAMDAGRLAGHSEELKNVFGSVEPVPDGGARDSGAPRNLARRQSQLHSPSA